MVNKKSGNSCDECNNRPNLMERLRKTIDFVKPFSIVLICFICSFGIVGFFIASIMIDSVTLDSLNSFISIVLGIVALTASIVSMFLSFYSLEKSEESDKELNKLLQEMKNIQKNTENIVSKIEEKQVELSKNILLSNNAIKSNSTASDQVNVQWQRGDYDNNVTCK